MCWLISKSQFGKVTFSVKLNDKFLSVSKLLYLINNYGNTRHLENFSQFSQMQGSFLQTNQSKVLHANNSQFMKMSGITYRSGRGVFDSQQKKDHSLKKSQNLSNYTKNYHDFIPKSKLHKRIS